MTALLSDAVCSKFSQKGAVRLTRLFATVPAFRKRLLRRLGARFRPEIHDVIGFGDHTEIVFDDNDGVSFVNEPCSTLRSNSMSAMCSQWLVPRAIYMSIRACAFFGSARLLRGLTPRFQLRHQLKALRFAAA
jgi:hypothetical protein